MGNAIKTSHEADVVTDDNIIRVLLPVYYNDEPMTPEEVSCVQFSWTAILEGSARKYLEISKEKDCPYKTCKEYFTVLFFDRMSNLQPVSQSIYFSFRRLGTYLSLI